MTTFCHCGKLLHYTDLELEATINELVNRFGDFIPVQVGERTFNVQRHYIALHGIKGEDISTLGFKEVKAHTGLKRKN
jgi:hypothetical protein